MQIKVGRVRSVVRYKTVKKYINIEVLKYLISGVMALLSEYAAFIGFYYLIGFNLSIANVLSFLIGLVVSFSFNKKWVFKSDKNTTKQFIKYFTLAFINVILSTILINILSTIVEPIIAKLYVVAIIATWNYIIYKKFIFS